MAEDERQLTLTAFPENLAPGEFATGGEAWSAGRTTEAYEGRTGPDCDQLIDMVAEARHGGDPATLTGLFTSKDLTVSPTRDQLTCAVGVTDVQAAGLFLRSPGPIGQRS
ncbi:hypothetical protein ACWD0J_17700 [Streptomyces sp. NPDC003011]